MRASPARCGGAVVSRGGKRPGAGRPRSDDSATALLRVRLTPDELEALRIRAENAGQTVSEYVRAALSLSRYGASGASTR